ncbi:30S ribosomal protein S18 [Bienertia sinuspersici]
MAANFACGLPIARRTSWTNENPGHKFVASKFYNYEIGQRGCNTFEWHDEDIVHWQKDVTSMLEAEKHSILKSRLVSESYEKDRLVEELEKMKKKSL